MLQAIEVPRYVPIQHDSQLHLFVDASKESYSACLFTRTETPNGVNINLIKARSRVAPLKSLTIPRLELMACVIGARIVHSIIKTLNVSDTNIFAWSDSMTALWWIKNRGDWSVFVANRVIEINKLITSSHWRHVPGKMNPADFLTRGCTPKELKESLWWKGPKWLERPHEQWPMNNMAHEVSVESERKQIKLCNLNKSIEELPWYAKRFSDYGSIIRLVAWVLRFIHNIRNKSNLRRNSHLTFEEKERAKRTIIRLVQNQYFQSQKFISNIVTFKDVHEILRVKTRITERADRSEFLTPIVSPARSVFTKRLIEHVHRQNCHVGTHILLNILREKYWVIKGRRTVRAILKNCIKCRRHNAKALASNPIALPGDRVNDTAIFEVVGVDLAGPLYLKEGSKVWVVLYTCAVYRAVHIELTTSLSTDTFLLSLRRFIARRGKPKIIYSDNGTNFRGAQRELYNVNWNKIVKETYPQSIKWKFIPPSAAWWGGWLERIIRMVKELLRRTLGKAILTFEELNTVICDCEHIINSRPLTYLSENTEDLIPLSPSMFLIENRDNETSQIDFRDATNLQKRIKYRMKLLKDLRTRFRKEYLGLLIQTKNNEVEPHRLKIGEIVLIGDDTKKRINWPLAKVMELYAGRDGQVRTVKLKTSTGSTTRPIQRVYPLEIPCRNQEQELTENVKQNLQCMLIKSLKTDMDKDNESKNSIKVLDFEST